MKIIETSKVKFGMELTKYNTAIKINKLDVFETEFISKKLQNLKESVINKSGKILQFRDDEYQLVSMTTSFIVDFNKFKQIHFS